MDPFGSGPKDFSMNNAWTVKRIEALLFLHGDSLTFEQLASWLDLEEISMSQWIDRVSEHLLASDSALEVRVMGDSVQLVTVPELDEWLSQTLSLPVPEPLSHAAWEVLSVVAYKQPLTRMEIEALRQTGSERAIDTLVSRGLIEEVGRKETPGRPILYGTTARFLQEFGISDPKDLPPLADSPPPTV